MVNESMPLLLIVDDNEKNLHATKRILETLDIHIHTVLSGEESLKAIVNHDYFLILMDVQMPRMDGFETVSLIRGNTKYQQIPIIFLTAIIKEDKYLLDAYSDGAVDYLFKPIEPIILQSKIKVFLDLYIATKKLEKLATSDVLTGLANRHMYQNFQNKTLAFAQRHNTYFAILFLDLDRFKDVNDTMGHETGDYLLKSVATRIQACIRDSDLLARMGGDEFAIILTEINQPEDASIVAAKILETLKPAHTIKGNEIFCSSSIGIACYPASGQTCEELNKAADTAMYSAKKQGKSYTFFSDDMQNQIQVRLSLIHGLRSTTDFSEFLIFYQPKVDIKTHKITGFEALLRWQHPELGFLNPNKFIPFAEKSGQIIRLGSWVLQSAVLQCTEWRSTQPELMLSITVNISFVQLYKVGFVQIIDDILHKSALPPELLHIELTESSVMKDPKASIKILSSIRELGVKITIDNFGTGYSSLSYLQQLPIDTIKIDMSLVQSIGNSEGSNTVVTAIINLAHTLGMNVVAVGVETKEQIEFLTLEGCDYLQGFYFNKPAPASKLKF